MTQSYYAYVYIHWHNYYMLLGEMHGIVGRVWCYDRCIHLPLMTSICNNNYKHNTLYVLSVQATV